MDGAAALLGLLLLLALLMWSLSLSGRSRSVVAGLSVLACAWALSWALPLLRALPPSSTSSQQAGELWQAWSPERMQELQAQGRPVFVDFRMFPEQVGAADSCRPGHPHPHLSPPDEVFPYCDNGRGDGIHVGLTRRVVP
jgi:hypothetical protein